MIRQQSRQKLSELANIARTPQFKDALSRMRPKERLDALALVDKLIHKNKIREEEARAR